MTVHTLHARLNHPDAGEIGKTTYHYDDPKHGVYCEQLVASTSEAIHCVLLSAGLWDDDKTKPERVTLRFTRTKSGFDAITEGSDPVIKLLYTGYANDMSTYLVEGVYPQSFIDEWDFMDDMGGPTTVELCGHLLDYFLAEPESFYCQLSLSAVSHGRLICA